MKTEIAKYVRGLLSLIILVGCMFFSDKLTISENMQATLLSTVLGFYFVDYVKDFFKKGK